LEKKSAKKSIVNLTILTFLVSKPVNGAVDKITLDQKGRINLDEVRHIANRYRYAWQ
jgi:hypothetical protein